MPKDLFATEDPAAIMTRAQDELDAKTRIHAKHWGLGSTERWDVDFDEGLIWFTQPDGRIISAPVQVIGTYDTEGGTWLWGWDHPSVDEPLAHAARLARAFGERHGLAQFTERKIHCSEDDAWTFTALAVLLTESWGAYRGPSGSTLVYMAFGEITLQRAS